MLVQILPLERVRRHATRVNLLAFFASCVFVPAFSSASLAQTPAPEDSLVDGFKMPPPAARPQVWWHWMSGNIDLEGAKLDLAWMKRIGIGGVHTFTGGGLQEPHVIQPPVQFMDDKWQATFAETVLLARSYGMEVTIAGSPGWSETGGPWVKPEDGMKKYVWSETQITGGTPQVLKLPAPPIAIGPFLGVSATRRGAGAVELTEPLYRDALVVAFPTPPADLDAPVPVYSTATGPLDLSAIATNDLAQNVPIPVHDGQSATISATFPQAVTISTFVLGLSQPDSARVSIEASDDGAQFRTVLNGTADDSEHPAAQTTYAFAPTRAKIFRVTLTLPNAKVPLPGLPAALSKGVPPPQVFSVTKFALLRGAHVNRFESKAGFQSTVRDAVETPPAMADAVIATGSVIDLTSKMRPDGSLDWIAPKGRWTVMRFGWSLTGQTNGPAEPKDTGLEVDKLDAVAVRNYIDHYLKMHRQAVGGDLGPASVSSLLTDSWEAGVQNWSPALLAEFKTRRAYDPLPYLPVLAGHVVDSASASDRFLWDFRRTLKEVLADSHYGTLADASHRNGMSYYTEAQGDTPRAIGDGFTMKSRADIPTAEFWYRPFATAPGQPSLQADLKEAASAAHLYGRPLAASESLTVAAGEDPWSFSPALLKPVVDEIFALGINRILLHESHHQPLVDRAPGLSMWFFGQFFNRNETWAEDAGPWIDYLARTSFLLQRGRYAADIAVFYGEDKTLTEQYEQKYDPGVPEGYGFDFVNPEALLNLISVGQDRLSTPSGMNYRLLYIPSNVTRFTLPTIRKLRELVLKGAVLVAKRPVGGLGVMSSNPEVLAVATELWGSESSPAGVRHVGAGRIYGDGDLNDAISRENIRPDVDLRNSATGTGFMSIHRIDNDVDIYFISNRRSAEQTATATFRVSSKIPDIWHAEDGRVEPVSYSASKEGVRVSLHFDSQEALFVVFRKPTTQPEWSKVAKKAGVLSTLTGSWKISFQKDRGAPPAPLETAALSDWSVSSNPGVKYFSGSAVYSKSFTVPRRWMKASRHFLIDLGTVHELAVVSLDGRPLTTLWHAPYKVDITRAVTPGSHRLEVKVINLWVNRLIGDKQPGATPVAFAPQSPYRSDSALLPSGLLGPVQILSEDE